MARISERTFDLTIRVGLYSATINRTKVARAGLVLSFQRVQRQRDRVVAHSRSISFVAPPVPRIDLQALCGRSNVLTCLRILRVAIQSMVVRSTHVNAVLTFVPVASLLPQFTARAGAINNRFQPWNCGIGAGANMRNVFARNRVMNRRIVRMMVERVRKRIIKVYKGDRVHATRA